MICRWFIKFGIIGWIWIDFALLNTLYKCQIRRFFDPLVKTTFPSELLFFQNRGLFFGPVIFHCFPPNPYTRRCVSTIESLSLFREILKNHGKLPVRSWFFGFSLIFDFSVYFNYFYGNPLSPITHCHFLIKLSYCRMSFE